MQPRLPESTDSTQQYLNEIGQYELLTAEQEAELAKQIELGKIADITLSTLNGEINDDERQKLTELAQSGLDAKEKFINSNLRLVVSVAKRQQHKTKFNDLLDLISSGNEGLIRAVEKFDYRRGFKFSTHATWWIHQAMSRTIANNNYPIRIPNHYYDKVSMYIYAVKTLSMTKSGTPSPEEIIEFSGLSPEEVEDIRVIYETQTNLVSLDMPVGEQEKSVEVNDFVPDDNQNIESEVLARLAPEEFTGFIKEVLPEEDVDIVLRRYGFIGRAATQLELSKEFGLTVERIRKIEKNAQEILKRDKRTQLWKS